MMLAAENHKGLSMMTGSENFIFWCAVGKTEFQHKFPRR